jgi:hypothetical protein
MAASSGALIAQSSGALMAHCSGALMAHSIPARAFVGLIAISRDDNLV